MQARTARKNRKSAEIVVETRAIMTARSEDAQHFINSGLSQHKHGRLNEALGAYQRALDTDGEDAYGRYLAGLALKGLGRESEAAAEWCRASELFALDGDSEWGLAMARKMLGGFS